MLSPVQHLWLLSHDRSRSQVACKAQIFPIWPCTEKVCQPHFSKIIPFLGCPPFLDQQQPGQTPRSTPCPHSTHTAGAPFALMPAPVPCLKGCPHPSCWCRGEDLGPLRPLPFPRVKTQIQIHGLNCGISGICNHGPRVGLS